MKTDYQVVFVTASTMEQAERIAEALVSESLAACANIIEGCRSIYRWQGKVETDDEVLLLIKARRGDFDAIEERVTALHSYDVPEIIAVDLAALSDGYRGFMEDALGG
ncbi:MAG: divalent-cation tolerance protein CutA [Candidatus Krumholzibacteriia bacterium]